MKVLIILCIKTILVVHENAIILIITLHSHLRMASLLIILEEPQIIDRHHLLEVFRAVLSSISVPSLHMKFRWFNLELAVKHF